MNEHNKFPQSKGSDFNFEEAIKKLGKIATQLEEGSPNLNEALRLFEEGMNLAKGCHDALQAAEQKVLTLTKNKDGKLIAKELKEKQQ